MRFVKFFSLASLMLAAGYSPACADILQPVRFAQAPSLVAWDQDGARQTGQRLTLKPHTASALHALPGSGTLAPIQISAPYSSTQAGEARFRIASNTGFKIRAQLFSESGPVHTPVNLEIISAGAKAKRPNLTKQGENLFQVANKTASLAGEPYDQSVEFKASWDSAMAADLVLVLTAN